MATYVGWNERGGKRRDGKAEARKGNVGEKREENRLKITLH